MSDEKLLAKIRQLLAIAEGNGASENESFQAAAQAQKLMIKNAISEAELAQSQKHSAFEEPIAKEFDLPAWTKDDTNTYLERFNLLSAISVLNNCKALCYTERSSHRGTVKKLTGSVRLVGFKSDVEAVELLFTVMQLHMVNAFATEWKHIMAERAADLWYPDEIPSQKGRGAYRRGFYQGFTSRLTVRLKEAKETVVEPGSGTDLVLRNRGQIVRRSPAAQGSGRGFKLRASQTDYRGYDDGARAAERVDLGRTKIYA
jgi:hypothetical protein